jgi:hypothetical protein
MATSLADGVDRRYLITDERLGSTLFLSIVIMRAF